MLGARIDKGDKFGKDAAALGVLWQHKEVPLSSLRFLGSFQWLFIILGIMSLVLAVYIIMRSRVDEATLADEYAILEDIIEGRDDVKETHS